MLQGFAGARGSFHVTITPDTAPAPDLRQRGQARRVIFRFAAPRTRPVAIDSVETLLKEMGLDTLRAPVRSLLQQGVKSDRDLNMACGFGNFALALSVNRDFDVYQLEIARRVRATAEQLPIPAGGRRCQAS